MLFDTHTHVQFEQYDADRDEVMKRASEAGTWMVNVGTDLVSSKKAVALARTYKEGVYASVGLHPNDVAAGLDFTPFEELAQNEKVVGIGETGLDYFRTTEKEKQELQKEIFIKHIELAHKVHKPLIIHCRGAHPDLLKMLLSTRYSLLSIPGVMHFFGGAGAWENLDAYLEMGFYISFAGVVTFSNYEHAQNIKKIPLERILVETDAPFAAPAPERGKRNEPSFIQHTARTIAELKGVGLEEVATQTTKNARTLFGV
ncbi:TatD family hydrolase [Candidatus Azambacteria bacterium]|nr:TatD family hydrolase [Candidatus Azambacteria bacterium]MBI3685594.1 TatD family hydrolase [Candidatus Azambacteria bacterium]